MRKMFVTCLALCAGLALVGCSGGSTTTVVDPAIPVPTLAPALSVIAGDIGGGAYSLDGDGTQARFTAGSGIVVDAGGTLVVIDGVLLRKVSPSGKVTTWNVVDAAGMPATFGAGAAMTMDRSGNLILADQGMLRRISAAGVVTTLPGAGMQTPFQLPQAMTLDSQGNLYVADMIDGGGKSGPFYQLWKVTPAGEASMLAAGGLAQGSVAGMTVDAAGTLFLALRFSGNLIGSPPFNQILRVGDDGSAVVLAGAVGRDRQGSVDGVGSAAQFQWLAGMTADGAGNLYVSDAGGIRRVTPAGEVTTLAGSRPAYGPGAIAIDAAGTLFLVDGPLLRGYAGGTFATVAGAAFAPRNTGSVDGIGTAALFTNPQGIAADANGNLFVADTSIHVIRKITPAGAVTTFAGLAGNPGSSDGSGSAARFNLPTGLAVNASGDVFVTDRGNATVRRITPAGTVTTLAGSAGEHAYVDGQGPAARFITPQGIVADSLGNLFVTDANAPAIRKITPAGMVSTFAGGGYGDSDGIGLAAKFSGIAGIAADAGDTLYVFEKDNGKLRKITAGAVVTTVATPGPVLPREANTGVAIALDAAGNVYIPAGSGIAKIGTDGRIGIVAGITGQDGILPGALPGRMMAPLGLARIGPFSLALSSGSSILRLDLP